MSKPARSCSRGYTLLELTVVFIVILALLAFVLVSMRGSRGQPLSLCDKAQLKQIQQAMLVFANDSSGGMPIPGRVAAQGIDDENHSLNHTANLYSLLVAAEFFNTDLLISPLEVSSHVTEMLDYNYAAYDPAAGSFWDDRLVMHLHDPPVGANASYAHMAFVGDRRPLWSSAGGASRLHLGSRGTRGGATSGPEYDRSPTLRMHGPKNQWIGNLVFGDNHTEVSNTFFPGAVVYDDGFGKPVRDNIFAAEFDHPMGRQAAADAFLCICIGADQYSVEDVYDPLD